MPPTRPAARALSSSQPTEVTRGVYSCRLLRHEDWLLRLPSAGLLRSEEHPRIGSGCAAKLPAASLMTPVTCSRSPRRSMTWMISRRESPTQARVRRTKPDTVVPMSYNVQRLATRRQARARRPCSVQHPPHRPRFTTAYAPCTPEGAEGARRRQPHCYLTTHRDCSRGQPTTHLGRGAQSVSSVTRDPLQKRTTDGLRDLPLGIVAPAAPLRSQRESSHLRPLLV